MDHNSLRILDSQKALIMSSVISQKSPGQAWYLVALPWYQLWSIYVGLDDAIPGQNYPGPIDNSSITDDKGRLLPGMSERNFMALPEYAWKELDRYYTICGKSPNPLVRYVVLDSSGNCSIELYPFNVVLCLVTEDDTVTMTAETMSRSLPLEQLYKRVTHSGSNWFGSKSKKIYFWIKQQDSNEVQIQLCNNPSTTLEELNVRDGALLVLKRSTDVDIPNLKSLKTILEAIGAKDVSVINQSSPSSNRSPQRDEKPEKSSPPGLCGLDNLGNTCFMNSIIQCLSNVPELREYFTTGQYKINSKHKELSDTYAGLMRSIWSGLNDTATPRDFRDAFLKHVPYLSEGQQDACNFLEGLLNCLSEELACPIAGNSVLLDRVPSEKAAREHWRALKKNNSSLVCDLFFGQLKSTLRCEVCNGTTVNYDSFTYLSLPLPCFQSLTVYFRYADPKKSVAVMTLSVPRNCRISDVRNLVAQSFLVNKANFNIARMTLDFRFECWYQEDDVPRFGDKKLMICFQLENNSGLPFDCLVECIVYIGSGHGTIHGFPYLLLLPRQTTTEFSLSQYIYYLVEPWLRFRQADSIPVEGCHYHLVMANYDLSGDRKQLAATNRLAFGVESSNKKAIIMLWSEQYFNAFFDKKLFEAHYMTCSKLEKHDFVSLGQCLSSYFKEELLSGSEAWHCPTCADELRPAYKKMDLTLSPPYFILHLNRFAHDDWGSNKMETLVDYPLTSLDLEASFGSRRKGHLYDLVAVVYHYGDITGGHYVARVFQSEMNKWFQFDDRKVFEVPPSRVQDKAAFMLFYQQRKETPI